MKVKFENNRLSMLPDNNEDERFARDIVRLIQAVSNNMMAWYGDVTFDKETSGYVITYKPTKKIGVNNMQKK